jgi:hypothetical protein
VRPVKTANSNHNFGPPAGCERGIGDLPCQRLDVDGTPTIRSVWEPGDVERAAIAEGANVELDVAWIGAFPPVALNVTDEQRVGIDGRPSAPGLRGDLATLIDAFADAPVTVQLLKIGEELGEASEAYIGLYGLNPRKGVTHSCDDVALELADVAVSAIHALSSFSADPLQALTLRFAEVAARLRALPQGRAA